MSPEERQESTAASYADSFLGRQIGGYRLVERIGEGGMGAVYGAVSTASDAQQKVAVKLIKRGMETDVSLRRFHNERRILAALDHPNIARLLDCGATENGLPYVVMEYVRGVPLTAYCDEHRLTVTERLQLFRRVCAAVQCAHEKQVIHRDIKPSNILVTPEGEPKLLDFGIAKVLDHEELSLSQPMPLTAHPVMTPQYASPEQVRGEQVTPASDIYSLGVVLYELLTGRRPYRLRSRSPHEILRVICEEEPEKPSAVILRTEPAREETGAGLLTPQAISETREGDPERLRWRLTGDLDKIVLMALRKAPAERYPTAEAFASDIARHLEGTPVAARTENLIRRGRKVFKRRSALVLAAVAAAILLFALFARRSGDTPAPKVRRSVAVLGFQNLAPRPETDWLSTALTEMLSTELAAGGKLRTIPGEQVSRVKMELAVPNSQALNGATLNRLRRSLSADYVVTGSYVAVGDPRNLQVRLDLRLQDTSGGELLAAITETQDSSDLLNLVTRTGALLRRRLGAGELLTTDAGSLRGSLPQDPEAARAYSEGLERLRTFDTLAARGLLKSAVRAAPGHALSHSALALASGLLGYDAEARDEAKRALDLSRDLSREDRLFIEGRYYESTRDWDKAVDMFRTLHTYYPDNLEYGLRLAAAQTQGGSARNALETLQTLRKLPAAAHDPRVDLAETEAALAISDLKLANAAAAKAIQMGTAQGSRILAARACLLRSRTLMESGEPQSSLAAANQARSLYEAAGYRQGVAWCLNEGAAVLTQQGDVAGARKNYGQAIAICRMVGDQTCIAIGLDSLGVLARRDGDFQTAVQMHEQALAVRRSTGDRAGIATSLYNLGNVLEKMGSLTRAREADSESLQLRRALGQKRAAALTLSRLASVRRKQGELQEALPLSREAVSALRAVGDRGGVALALYNLGECLLDSGDLRGARHAFEEALAVRRQQSDRNNTAEVLAGLARVALASGDLAEARRFLEESIALRRDLGEKNALAQSRLALAGVELETGNPKGAESLIRQAVAGMEHDQVRGMLAEARLLLSASFLARRQPAAAQREAEQAEQFLRNSEDRRLLISLQLMNAQIDAVQGRSAAAATRLKDALGEANRLGLAGMQFEARLGLGRLGQTSLPQVAEEAARAGYHLLARKASAAPALPANPL